MKPTRITLIDICWSITFLGVLLILLYKCQFGFADKDEAFYLSIPIRLVQGDSLLGQEWHVSALSSVLLYPFVKIYL